MYVYALKHVHLNCTYMYNVCVYIKTCTSKLYIHMYMYMYNVCVYMF